MGTASRSVFRSRNVLLLGLVSLLNDAASEMVVPLLPAFLGTLGAGALALGWVEGSADFASSVLKLAAGRWADRLGRNRPFVIAGYALAALARPLLAWTGAAWQVVAVRVADRTGKGLRSAPRDAILAGSVPAEQRGRAFGLHRAMDHFGAVVGPLAAVLLLSGLSLDLRTIFLCAAIPGVLTVVAVVVGVREPPAAAPVTAARVEPASPSAARPGLARFLVPLSLFTLGNASDTFLLLQAGAQRTPLVALPLLWMALHVVKSVTSLFGGRLADRWGRRPTILLGWITYAVLYVGFAFATGPIAIAALFVAYGAHHGLSEAAEKALVSELVPKSSWGRGFGWYHFVVGLLTMIASVLFGAIWTFAGPREAFLTSAGIATIAAVALALAPRLDAPRSA